MNTTKLTIELNGSEYIGESDNEIIMLLKKSINGQYDNLIDFNENQTLGRNQCRISRLEKLKIIIMIHDLCIYSSEVINGIHDINLPPEIISLWEERLQEIRIYFSSGNYKVECFFPEEKDTPPEENSQTIKSHLDIVSITHDKKLNLFKIKIRGWAFDDSSILGGSMKISLYVDNKCISTTNNHIRRDDVATAHQLSNKFCGFYISGAPTNINTAFLRYQKGGEYLTHKIDVPDQFIKISKRNYQVNVNTSQEFEPSKIDVLKSGKRIKLSIIVLTRLAHSLCIPLLQRIKTDCRDDELIVVCHELINSDIKIIESIADKVISISGNFNWSKFNNIASKYATEEYLLFINDDIYPSMKNWRNSLSIFLKKGLIIGAEFLSPDLALQHTGIGIFGNTAITLDSPSDKVNAVTGAFLAVHRETFNKIKLFDEKFAITFNDVDFCLRAANFNLEVLVPSNLVFYHFESSTRHMLGDDSIETNNYISKKILHYSEPIPIDEKKSSLLNSEPIQIIKHKRIDIQTIAIIKVDHIGDFFSSIDSFKKLQSYFPKTKITLFCSPEVSDFAKTLGIFCNVIPFRAFNKKSELGPDQGIFNLIDKFDLAIDLRKHAGARQLITEIDAEFKFSMTQSSSADESFLRKNLIKCFSCHSDEHDLILPNSIWQEAISFADFIYTHISSLATQVEDGELISTGIKPKKIAIFPFAGGSAKEWPLELYVRLAKELRIKFPNIKIEFFSEESNLWKFDTYSSILQKHLIDVNAPKNVLDILLLLKDNSSLVISNDSGPSWIASYLKIPSVKIFSGVIEPLHWLPDQSIGIKRNVSCSPCFISSVNQCHRNLFCLNSISPNRVLQVIESLI